PIVRQLETRNQLGRDTPRRNAAAGDCNSENSVAARAAAAARSRTARRAPPRPSASERTTPCAHCRQGSPLGSRSAGCPEPGAGPGTPEPRNPAPTDGTPLRLQRAMNSGTAVGPAVLLEEPLNPPLQLPVLRRVSTLGSLPPGVVAGPRDAVHRTEPRHPEFAPLRVDEREDVGFRVAQNRMAFLRGHAPPAKAHGRARAPGAVGSPAAAAASPRPRASRAARRPALASATATT